MLFLGALVGRYELILECPAMLLPWESGPPTRQPRGWIGRANEAGTGPIGQFTAGADSVR